MKATANPSNNICSQRRNDIEISTKICDEFILSEKYITFGGNNTKEYKGYMIFLSLCHPKSNIVTAHTLSLSSSLETVIRKLSGIVVPLIIAVSVSESDIPRCFVTESEVDFVEVAVSPRKQRMPKLSRRTCVKITTAISKNINKNEVKYNSIKNIKYTSYKTKARY